MVRKLTIPQPVYSIFCLVFYLIPPPGGRTFAAKIGSYLLLAADWICTVIYSLVHS